MAPRGWCLPALLIVGFPISAQAGSPAADVAATLEARAEAPAEVRIAPPPALGTASGRLLFSMTGADNAPVVRSVPDVNSDGREEVLVGIDESGVDNIFLLDGASSGTATVLWSLETMDGLSGGSPYGDLALTPVSDADDNGFDDFLAGTAWGGRTAYRIDTLDGTIHWRFDTYLEFESGWVYSLDEVGDVNEDGVPESVFGAGADNQTVFLIDGASGSAGQATFLWRYPAPSGVLAVRAMGDVNGDGDGDVLAAVGDQGEVALCLSGGSTAPAGTLLWSFPAGATVFAVERIPDQTGDGVAEALVGLWSSDGKAVRALNGATGSQLWESTQVAEFAMLLDLLGDVTGDGVPEVIVSSWENAAIVLNGATGEQVWKRTVGTLNGGDVWTARAIGDINGDGLEDVIAGSFDYHVYALDGVSGAVEWSYDTGNRVFSVHSVGDLDGDGVPEVAVGTQDTNSNVVVFVLDGDGSTVFRDGFESGGTGEWSVALG